MYTDGNNSISKTVGIYRRPYSVGNTVGIYRRTSPSVYTDGVTDGVCSSSGNTQWHGDVRWFYRRELPRDSNWDDVALSPTASPTESPTKYVRRWFRRKKPLYTPIRRHSLPLFLLLLLSHPTSPLPNCSQTPIPNSPLFSTRALKFLISCTWSQYPFLVDFIIFFVSKSILFSFNI